MALRQQPPHGDQTARNRPQAGALGAVLLLAVTLQGHAQAPAQMPGAAVPQAAECVGEPDRACLLELALQHVARIDHPERQAHQRRLIIAAEPRVELVDQALAELDRIADRNARLWQIAQLGVVLAEADATELASRIAALLASMDWDPHRVQGEIALSHARSGAFTKAFWVTSSMSDTRLWYMNRIAGVMANAGQPEDALALVRSLPSGRDQAEGLIAIAGAFPDDPGHPDPTRISLLQEALEILRDGSSDVYDPLWLETAAQLRDAEMFAQAADIIGSLDAGLFRDHHAGRLVRAQIDAGFFDAAIDALGLVAEEPDRHSLRVMLIHAMASASQIEQAREELHAMAAEDDWLSAARRDFATGLAAAGHINAAIEEARQIEHAGMRATTLADLFKASGSGTLLSETLSAIDDLDDPLFRTHALTLLATAFND